MAPEGFAAASLPCKVMPVTEGRSNDLKRPPALVVLTRRLAGLGWCVVLAALVLVLALALCGRAPRPGDWLDGSPPLDAEPPLAATVATALGLLAIVTLLEALLLALVALPGRREVVAAHVALAAAPAHERMLKAIDRLLHHGYHMPPEGPGTDALAALSRVRLVRPRSLWRDDVRHLAQEVSLECDASGLRVEHRWRGARRGPDRGEEDYRRWLVEQLARGRSLRDGAPARLFAHALATPLALAGAGAANAVLPVVTPAAVAWTVVAGAVLAVLVLGTAVVGRRLWAVVRTRPRSADAPARIDEPGLALAVLALVLATAAPIAWEVGGTGTCAPEPALARKAAAPRGDALAVLARHAHRQHRAPVSRTRRVR